ncbi:spicule matrix protein [Amphibalanus amphitrite]|uniref:Spicule matrix protein n=1 Tax=Amphibalanus amphitrite TaxID=1232801 RepID=A0A6A4VYD1_AMPAM|nr:spicule matrix protein [Amphibalanus amphitrite]
MLPASNPDRCRVYQWKLLHHVCKDHLVMLNPVHLSLQVHRLYGHIRICIQTGRPELEFTPLMRDPKCATFVTEEICEQLRRRAAAEDSDSGVEVEVSDAKDGAAGGAPSASGGSALSKLNEETHAYCRGAAPPAVYSDSESGAGAAQPGVSGTQPGVGETQSGVSEAQPGVNEAQPGVSEAQPDVSGAQPGLSGAQPGISEAQPGVSEAQPGVSEAQPGVNEAQPGLSGAQPGISEAQPGVSEAQPGVSEAQPGVSEAQPGVSEAQPGVSEAQPGVSEAQPGVSGAQPGVSGVQPGVSGVQPGVSGAQPGVHGTQPLTDRAQPGVSGALEARLDALEANLMRILDILENRLNQGSGNGRSGIAMPTGVSFPKPTSLPRPFVLLKAAIKAHLVGGGHQKKKEELKKQSTDTTFRRRVMALLDIYNVLGQLSKDLQNLQKLPWERLQLHADTVKKLEQMAGTLAASASTRRGSTVLSSSDIADMLREEDPTELKTCWPNLLKHADKISPDQSKEIKSFAAALADHCRRREKSTDARGATKGCHNAQLMDAMNDIRTASDLHSIKQSRTSSVAVEVQQALHRLKRRRMIPDVVTGECLKVAYQALQNSAPNLSNQELLKFLWERAKLQAALTPYVDTVIRLWLLCPAESVVESMGSTVKAVFGVHRQLRHDNAEKELIVRWNGPDPAHSDYVVQAALKRGGFDFVRSTVSIVSMLQSTVIARHKAAKCARTYIFHD